MIRFEDAAIGFKDKLLFEHFNLAVGKGDKVLLVSPSGRGKTSILKALLGFVPLAAGRILYNDAPLDKRTFWDLRKQAAYVPQNTDLGEGRIDEFLKQVWSLKAAGGTSPPLETLTSLFRTFRLPEGILSQDFEKLSGGEKQRVAFAVAAALDRPVVLLDEPAASLDGELKDITRDYILSKDEWTVIAVSHEKDWIDTGRFRVVDVEEFQCNRP